MFKKYISSLSIVLGLGLVFTNKAYAAVDITLEDYPENDTLSVIINSNESYVDGIDMGIIFSEDITITKITPTEGFCSFGGNTTFEGNRISIECFNDAETEMDGVLATIKYQTEADDYFFYVDQNTLDIGSLILGKVTNVNKPEEVVVEENTEVIEEESAGFNFSES